MTLKSKIIFLVAWMVQFLLQEIYICLGMELLSKKIKLIPNHFNEFPANFNFLKRIAFIFYSYFKKSKKL